MCPWSCVCEYLCWSASHQLFTSEEHCTSDITSRLSETVTSPIELRLSISTSTSTSTSFHHSSSFHPTSTHSAQAISLELNPRCKSYSVHHSPTVTRIYSAFEIRAQKTHFYTDPHSFYSSTPASDFNFDNLNPFKTDHYFRTISLRRCL